MTDSKLVYAALLLQQAVKINLLRFASGLLKAAGLLYLLDWELQLSCDQSA